MNILAIESSCDETAAAIIKDGTQILSNVVVSQIDIFAAYGGVIPEIAARSHLEAILPVVNEAILQAEKNSPQFCARNRAFERQNHTQEGAKRGECVPPLNGIDSIAVTHTPGLLGSLLVGTLTARTLAILHNKPLYPIHHLKSHIYANWLKEGNSSLDANSGVPATGETLAPRAVGVGCPHPSAPRLERAASGDEFPSFPLLALIISGGHTQIIHMATHNQFQIIGTTRDDAVGECYDKVAKILGLPYPGGPSIAAAAEHGDPHKYHFPHPHLTHPARSGNASATPSLDFSFSGLKTAVLREVQKSAGKPISFPSHQLAPLLTQQQVYDFAASFQQTATDILLEKLHLALQQYPDTQSIVFAGGVSANQHLRAEAAKQFPHNSFFPQPKFSGDNAAMVGAAAFYEIQSGATPTDPYHLDISPRSPIQ